MFMPIVLDEARTGDLGALHGSSVLTRWVVDLDQARFDVGRHSISYVAWRDRIYGVPDRRTGRQTGGGVP